MQAETYYSNGKLLLTGEYVVLDGALSLAIPTAQGQYLEVRKTNESKINWKSLDYTNKLWFEATLTLQDIIAGAPNMPDDKSIRLFEILQTAKQLNPNFLKDGYHVETKLTFPQSWGLGSSSTLINNIANWAKVDAYQLLAKTFGGSGYDIACAENNKPITYQLSNNKHREIKEVTFNPTFKGALYFVYLNKKQNSREGIAQYKSNKTNKTKAIKEISEITSSLINCNNLKEFNILLDNHEHLISKIIHQSPVKERLFSDFKGSIKSLGAWGGDFVLATSEGNPRSYFNNKGYDTIIPYTEMIK